MVRASAGGGIAGFIADTVLGTFPLGTVGGTFHKALFSLFSGDMDRAHDPARATQGSPTFDFGELKGMASGLFEEIKGAFDPDAAKGGRTAAYPGTREEAFQRGRPHVSEDARQEAQSQSGLGGWGKALMYGGLALGALSLMNEFSLNGAFGMPFYGGMAPWMMGPIVPGMTPGVFW